MRSEQPVIPWDAAEGIPVGIWVSLGAHLCSSLAAFHAHTARGATGFSAQRSIFIHLPLKNQGKAARKLQDK